MVAAGWLYAVHCLWWVRRRGREGCKGEGRESGRIICASISIGANTAEGEGRWEKCRGLPVNRRGGGEGAESSLALYANQQDPKAQMSHDQDRGAEGGAAEDCTVPTRRGCVSSAMMSWFILRKWCQGSAVRLIVSTAEQHSYRSTIRVARLNRMCGCIGF